MFVSEKGGSLWNKTFWEKNTSQPSLCVKNWKSLLSLLHVMSTTPAQIWFSHTFLKSFFFNTFEKLLFSSIEDFHKSILLMLFKFCQRSLNVISNPAVPLEEWLSTFLALFKDLVSILLHLYELGLFLMSHDLWKESHDEKFVVGILASTFLTITIQTWSRLGSLRSTTELTTVFATVRSV